MYTCVCVCVYACVCVCTCVCAYVCVLTILLIGLTPATGWGEGNDGAIGNLDEAYDVVEADQLYEEQR